MDRRSFVAGTLAGTLAGAALAHSAGAQTAPFGAAIALHAARGGEALVIQRNGVVWAEHYAPSADPYAPRDIGGGTSAFIPALVGALVNDRLMRLDEAAVATLTEWAAHPSKSRITVRMLLDLTCGLTGAGRMLSTPEALALEPIAEPGAAFIHDPAPTKIFLEIARRKLAAANYPGDAADYITARVFDPVGCAPLVWARQPDGEVDLTDGARISARAWARWGELIRRLGVWRATQVLSADALRDAARGSWPQPRYGFGLWLAWPARDEAPPLAGTDVWGPSSPAPPDLVMAASATGDRLYVLPTQGIVATRQAADGQGWSDAAFLAALLRQG
jgi:hypothetical protein